MPFLRWFFGIFYVGFDMFFETSDALWEARCAECAEKGRTE